MEKYLTSHEAAKFIGISRGTLRNWLAAGLIKPAAVYKNLHLWAPEQLEDYKALKKGAPQERSVET